MFYVHKRKNSLHFGKILDHVLDTKKKIRMCKKSYLILIYNALAIVFNILVKVVPGHRVKVILFLAKILW